MNYYNDYLVMQSGAACRGIVHTIVKGDTLYRLGRLYNVPLEAIFDANPDADVYNLKIGEKVCIPIGSMPPMMPGTNEIVVEKAQRLSEFLKNHSLSLDEFERFNPKFQPQMLAAGERVRLPRQKI